jgi:anti-anti-sigma factor
MQIWTVEIKELEILYNSIKGRFPELEKDLETALKDVDSNLILDMEKVQYLSSGGVRLLILLQKKLKKREGNLYLCHAAGD